MVKTRQDFIADPPAWLIDDWMPLEHRCMDTAPEGSYKTIFGAWLAVCIAAGLPVFGHPTYQGPVLIIDEETPLNSLEFHLKRFAQGLGVSYRQLPIFVESMQGYKFNNKKSIKTIQNLIDAINPVFVRIDSLVAMSDDDSDRFGQLGKVLRDELASLVSPRRAVMVAAHAKKFIADLTLDEMVQREMQTVVRGHGTLVGEACDTGYMIKKIGEYPKPSRFCVITKPRRQAIPGGNLKFIELVEEKYGSGWARLEEIPASKLPPSDEAKEVYKLMKKATPAGNNKRTTGNIKQTCALLTQRECRNAVKELLSHKAILIHDAQEYELNTKYKSAVDPDYLRELES